MKSMVVCGLLGSGKTTFIRNYLDGRSGNAVVLVNDFGQTGIDGEIFSAGGIESVELPSGCVCCTLKADLITTIRRIVQQFSPGHLLIEPSGVASPSGVLEALESAGVGRASVVGIVDVAEFAELYDSGMYGDFFREQIELSDAILMNKADLADEELIAASERMIAAINPRAVLFRTVNAQIGFTVPDIFHPLPLQEKDGVRGESFGKTGVRGDADSFLPLFLRERDGVRGSLSWQRNHCHFEALSFKLPRGTELAGLGVLFKDMAKGVYGSIARAKALVQTAEGPYRFDLTFGKVNSALFEKEITDSRLVVIGERLDETGIGKALGQD